MERRAKPEIHRSPHPRAVSIDAGVTVTRRRHPVSVKEPVAVKAQCAEVAGGTAAHCAAVVCCCPIGLVGLLFLVSVRLPAALCRRALRKMAKRRKEIKRCKAARSLLEPKAAPVAKRDDDDVAGKELEVRGTMQVAVALGGAGLDVWTAKASAAEVEEMEKEVWAKFYGMGF